MENHNAQDERAKILENLERYLFEGPFIGLKEESLIRLALQLEELERAESDDGSTIGHGDRESIFGTGVNVRSGLVTNVMTSFSQL